MKLYLKQNILSLVDTYRILDENGDEMYYARSQFFKFFAEIDIINRYGDIVYTIKRIFSFILPRYEIIKDGVVIATLNSEGFFIKSWNINTSERNLYLEGDILAYDLSVYEDGRELAHIRKKFFALSDSYEIDIANDEDADLIATLIIAIDNAYHNNNN